MLSHVSVRTAHASRYLQQLCKHWSHRFAVTFDPQKGEIVFDEGQVVRLTARSETLDIEASVEDAAQMEQFEKVISSHIERFAFREELQFDWQRGPAGEA